MNFEALVAPTPGFQYNMVILLFLSGDGGISGDSFLGDSPAKYEF